MSHINIEIKARCSNPEKIREILKSKNADFKGIDSQIDTYLKVSSGKLKLREGNIENFLIFYERENKKGPKQSNITLFKLEPNSNLKKILTESLGVLVVVNKQREIYFIKNVKFHIDLVKGLGTFIEIEAKDEKGKIGKDKLLEQCNHYIELFGIKQEDLINCSYSDLLLERINKK